MDDADETSISNESQVVRAYSSLRNSAAKAKQQPGPKTESAGIRTRTQPTTIPSPEGWTMDTLPGGPESPLTMPLDEHTFGGGATTPGSAPSTLPYDHAQQEQQEQQPFGNQLPTAGGVPLGAGTTSTGMTSFILKFWHQEPRLKNQCRDYAPVMGGEGSHGTHDQCSVHASQSARVQDCQESRVRITTQTINPLAAL